MRADVAPMNICTVIKINAQTVSVAGGWTVAAAAVATTAAAAAAACVTQLGCFVLFRCELLLIIGQKMIENNTFVLLNRPTGLAETTFTSDKLMPVAATACSLVSCLNSSVLCRFVVYIVVG